MTVTNYEEAIKTYETPAYKKRKRRIGDRKEGRRLRTLHPIETITPYIMRARSDAQNHFEDVIDITNIEKFLAEKHKNGYPEMTLLHVLLAAYVRILSERPGLNRFIAGQRIYSRNNIECVMTVKKEMSVESPDTVIKVEFDPRDDIYNVFNKFQATARKAIAEETSVDGTARILTKLPRFVLRSTMAFLRFLDYHGWLPRSLEKISPFHGSIVVTSMGSIGIPAVYHHLYDFGTLPIFFSYGNIFTADAIKRDGTRETHRFVTFRVVTDERICDGFYYASAFKRLMRYMQHPEQLETSPETILEDID